ncbi:unnamed protein product [Sphagnum troendelagicum]|uniref:PPM-type phosphatase domain-containing protein n=1 Tax=Sphagnum troendelagicum TaxID=128251 RepID=A0ABP0TN72_9BRYO
MHATKWVSSRVLYGLLRVIDVCWQASFWSDPTATIRESYLNTDIAILDNSSNLEPGGSTSVTAILIDGKDLLMANVEDSSAVLSKGGVVE